MQALILRSINIATKYPRVFGLVGGLITLLSLPMGSYFYQNYQRYSLPPAALSPEEALSELSRKDEVWVTVSDPKWHCESIFELDRGDPAVILTGRSAERWFVAHFHSPMKPPCRGSVTGVLERANERRLRYFSNYGFVVPRRGALDMVPVLCTWCGASDALWGLGLAAALALIGVSMYPLARRLAADHAKR